MEKKSKDNYTKKMVLAIMGIFLILVAVVLIIIFLLNGRTTVGDLVKNDIVMDSMSCESSDVEYPIFSFDESDKKSLKINMIFADKKLDTLSLVYRLYYDSSDKIKNSEVSNHIDMNESFADSGLPADSFGAIFAILDDSLQMTLNVYKRQIDGISSKYFLLDDVSSFTKDNLKKHYESKGFECKEVIDNK